jgi:hypothetical protein
VSGIFLPLRVNSLPLATIYEVKIPLRKWKKSLLQRNPAQMTRAHALFKMVRYVILRPLRPELDAKTKTCLPAKTRFCHLDEQAKRIGG